MFSNIQPSDQITLFSGQKSTAFITFSGEENASSSLNSIYSPASCHPAIYTFPSSVSTKLDGDRWSNVKFPSFLTFIMHLHTVISKFRITLYSKNVSFSLCMKMVYSRRSLERFTWAGMNLGSTRRASRNNTILFSLYPNSLNLIPNFNRKN